MSEGGEACLEGGGGGSVGVILTDWWNYRGWCLGGGN